MSRRAASQISPRSSTFEERAIHMMERAYENCSTYISNTIQNIRLRDRMPNAAGASNVTHTAFENEQYDDIMNPVQAGRVWSQEDNNNNNNNNNDDDDDDDDNINNNSNTAQSTELDTVFQNIKAHGAFKSIKSAQNTMTNKNKQKQRQTKLEVNSERRRRARERLPARGREPKRQHRRINESSSKCWFRVNIHIGGRVCGQMRGVPSGDRNTGWSARENRQVSEIKMILIQNDERLWRRYNQVRGIWDAADGDVSVINACYLGNVSERTCVSDQLATLVPLSSAL